MIWKIVMVWSVALYVQGEEDAISEQRVVIHHKKSSRGDSLSRIGPSKSGNQDEYAQAYPSYEFSYKVNDPKTLDIKGQHETREGDEVIGKYWLIEPSGRKRTVNYQANDDLGFNAQIAYTASLNRGKANENVNQGKITEQNNIEQNNEQSNERNNDQINEQNDERNNDQNNEQNDEQNNEPNDKQSSEQNAEQNNEQPNNQNNEENNDENNKENRAENIGEVITITIGEENENIRNRNDASGVNIEPAPVVENNLSSQNEFDSQKDEANIVNNFDRNDDGKNSQSSQITKNNSKRDNNKRNFNKSRNVTEKGKGENNKRNKIRDQILNSNENNKKYRERPRNSKRVKQSHRKENDKNDRNVHKGKKVNDNRINMHNSEENTNNGDSNITKYKGQSDVIQNERLVENNNHHRERDYLKIKSSSYVTSNVPSSDIIERKFDIPNNDDTFEHRIRIYHPKNTAPTNVKKHKH